MKNYYSILGISPSAPAADIKRAYRKLAFTYHPDKNPTPAAEQFFKEVNEAYDVLGDAKKRYAYDQRRVNPVYEAPAPQPSHRDPKYRPAPNQHSRARGKDDTYELMQEYLPRIVVVTKILLGLGMLLLLDFILPRQTVQEEYKSHTCQSASRRSGGGTHCWVYTVQGTSFRLESGDLGLLAGMEKVVIKKSWIMREVTHVQSGEQVVVISSSIYGNFIFVPLTLLLVSLLAYRFRKDVIKGFNTGVTAGLIFIFALIYYLITKL